MKIIQKIKKVITPKKVKKVKVVEQVKVELTNQEIYDSLGKKEKHKRRSELGV